MKTTADHKSDLKKKFELVTAAPQGFGFFVAVHDFIEHIELNPVLAKGLSARIKINKELDVLTKYDHLKQIYQGVEDINTPPDADIGHTRYSVVRELSRIQKNDVSDSNTFWKKREVFRKLAGIVYTRLDSYLSGPQMTAKEASTLS